MGTWERVGKHRGDLEDLQANIQTGNLQGLFNTYLLHLMQDTLQVTKAC